MRNALAILNDIYPFAEGITRIEHIRCKAELSFGLCVFKLSFQTFSFLKKKKKLEKIYWYFLTTKILVSKLQNYLN